MLITSRWSFVLRLSEMSFQGSKTDGYKTTENPATAKKLNWQGRSGDELK